MEDLYRLPILFTNSNFQPYAQKMKICYDWQCFLLYWSDREKINKVLSEIRHVNKSERHMLIIEKNGRRNAKPFIFQSMFRRNWATVSIFLWHVIFAGVLMYSYILIIFLWNVLCRYFFLSYILFFKMFWAEFKLNKVSTYRLRRQLKWL